MILLNFYDRCSNDQYVIISPNTIFRNDWYSMFVRLLLSIDLNMSKNKFIKCSFLNLSFLQSLRFYSVFKSRSQIDQYDGKKRFSCSSGEFLWPIDFPFVLLELYFHILYLFVHIKWNEMNTEIIQFRIYLKKYNIVQIDNSMEKNRLLF
jgi:hypothetical protein